MFRNLFSTKPAVSVIRLSGVIGQGGMFRKGITLESTAPVIHRAFNRRGISAVALIINSPGGSPVQSDLIASRIRRYADEKGLPVWAFCEDAAASGGYWLACSADRIYAAKATAVGSIGVVAGSFGFVDLMKVLGVERRLYTAGTSKAMLDRFQPENPEEVAKFKVHLAEIHQGFIDYIRARRGDRLREDAADLFSGEFWNGGKALELGLVDGIGDIRSVVEKELGPDVKYFVEKPKKGFLSRISPFGTSRSWSDDLVESALAAAVESAMWSRLNL